MSIVILSIKTCENKLLE